MLEAPAQPAPSPPPGPAPGPRAPEYTAPALSPSGIAVGGRSGFNPVLDGVRGTAILLVMLYHMTVMEQHTRLDHVFAHVMGLGWVGVDLFFVLSGFLITGILWDSKLATAPRDYFVNFYARRTLRIFPLYYAVVFFCLVVIPHVLPAVLHRVVSPNAADLLMSKINRFGYVTGYEAWFWLYLCNIPMAWLATYMHGILGVCWSLAIEEQFYLVWPAVVRVCTRQRLVRVCGIVFAAALAWRLVLQFGFDANHVAVYVSTFSRMDALVAGAWLALLVRRPGGVDLRAAARRARPAAIAAGAVALAIAIAETWGPVFDPEKGLGIGHTPWFATFGLTLLSVVFVSVLIMALASPRGGVLNRVFTSRLLRTLGKYAYAMYLFHQPIRAIFRDLLFGPMDSALIKFRLTNIPFIGPTQLPSQIIYFVLCISATLAAAWVSWRVFENPILKLKKYFPSGAEQPVFARCPNCGYDLRGLDTGATCPECGDASRRVSAAEIGSPGAANGSQRQPA